MSQSPTFLGSSPHTRGAPPGRESGSFGEGIIPAYAGSTCTTMKSSRALVDHPRIRGEHSWRLTDAMVEGGSSPHTRGARADEPRHRRRKRIIPAYAGSTQRDPPRPGKRSGSSPHTRGARIPLGAPAWAAGIIPAYAGSTSPPSAASPGRADHPRIRGEHRRVLGDIGPGDRIIPAYAGSTPEPRPSAPPPPDHPRIRGEHTYMPEAGFPVTGSSPHTRGARELRGG